MASDTLRVVARLVAKPDKVDELRTLLTGLLEPTRAEPGCISYEL
ncbi:MAG: antibiotic biosynthesis monooxygenase, partial [Acidobacteria bacterium]